MLIRKIEPNNIIRNLCVVVAASFQFSFVVAVVPEVNGRLLVEAVVLSPAVYKLPAQKIYSSFIPIDQLMTNKY